MGALFNQFTAAQHKDAIRGLHRGQAVGDDNGGALLQDPVEISLERRLRLRVHKGGGFIHHQHRWLADRHPGHRQQLAFT